MKSLTKWGVQFIADHRFALFGSSPDYGGLVSGGWIAINKFAEAFVLYRDSTRYSKFFAECICRRIQRAPPLP